MQFYMTGMSEALTLTLHNSVFTFTRMNPIDSEKSWLLRKVTGPSIHTSETSPNRGFGISLER